jgi:outer membrane protein OmpA-like peptidoglycan-associated protein
MNVYGQLYSLTSAEFFVYFDTDSYSISEKQKKLLANKIVEIGGTNIKEIYVEGHTDSFATNEHNQILATNRAQATVSLLQEIGVPSRFIKMESFGESQLISDRAENNRRARVFFIYESDKRSILNPPKWIVVKTIDKSSKKPINSSIGFDYKDMEMKFTTTGSDGETDAFSVLGEHLEIIAASNQYLSNYLNVPLSDFDKPTDTLIYTLELVKVKVTGKFTFNHIYFFTDSDEIRPESMPELYKLLAVLNRNNSAYIEIQGHMNCPIDRPMNSVQYRFNMELSYKRAKAINDYLVISGIDQKRLTYKGLGNSRMKFKLPKNKEEEDQNKRVEIYTLKEI